MAMVAVHGVILTGGMAGVGGMANIGATAYVGGAATTAHAAHGVILLDPAVALPKDHGTTAMLAVMACDYAAAMLAAAWLFRLRTIERCRISAT